MAVITAAGTKIYIGSATDDDPDTAETFEMDSYTEIGEVVSIPEFGSRFSEIRHVSLGDRFARKFKGTEDSPSLDIPIGRDPSDAGQAACIAARASDSAFNFKIELNDKPDGSDATPSIVYWKGRVSAYTINVGDAESIVGATLGIMNVTRPVEVAAEA